jgi:hypothetical protein
LLPTISFCANSLLPLVLYYVLVFHPAPGAATGIG